ncbi:MAG: GHKL domain-containing protein [Bacteroidetes bacterium]|nr:GHKL domain-containing protein [Bacteroidota bacterium]
MLSIYKLWRIFISTILISLAIVFLNLPLVAQKTQTYGATLLNAGFNCLDDEEFPLALEILTQAVEVSKLDSDRATEVDAIFYLAQAKFWLAQYESANEDLYMLMNEFPKELKRTDSMSILRLISQNHYYMGNYDLAHELALERLQATEASNDSFDIAKSYQVLSEIECRQKNYDLALKHVQISKRMFEQLGKKDELSYNLDLMGDIFHNTQRYEEALAYKIASCEVIDTTGSLYNNAYCNHTIALTLSKMGRLEEAIPLFQLALKSWLVAEMPEETALTRACLGEAIAWSGQCKKGLSMVNEALLETEKLSLGPLRRDILEKLFQLNKHCGQIDEAFIYLEKYIAVNDSLNNQNTKVRIASLNNSYELQKKNSELELLKKTERVKAYYIIFLSIVVLLLIGLAGFSYILLKKQRNYSLQLDHKSKLIARQLEDIHRTNEKLQLANKELEQFAYIASHDLKAPLRTIGNYSSLINRRYGALLDENGVTFLLFITEAAKHMNALLEDIFSYSNIVNRKAEMVEVNMQERLDLALKFLNEGIESKQAVVLYDKLPSVIGNPSQLYQLVQNLLDNALKFIPKDRKPELKIKLAEAGEFYKISVTDNGIGIPIEKQDDVFTIFKRLHTKEEFRGTGIGLSICKKIVEGHGGKIWAESDGKRGTSFHFTLRRSINNDDFETREDNVYISE